MTPYDFGQILGAAVQQEKEAGVGSAVARGLLRSGKGLMRSGNNMLVNSSPPWVGMARGGARSFALNNIATQALQNPMYMARGPFARVFRSGLQGSVMRNIGRVLAGAGINLDKLV